MRKLIPMLRWAAFGAAMFFSANVLLNAFYPATYSNRVIAATEPSYTSYSQILAEEGVLESELNPKLSQVRGFQPPNFTVQADQLLPLSSLEVDASTSEVNPQEKALDKFNQYDILVEADQLYLSGNKAQAEQLYRQVKQPFETEQELKFIRSVTNPKQLAPEVQLLWNEAKSTWETQSDISSLQQFVSQNPEYIPGQLLLSEAYQKQDKPEEALNLLEQATNLFPDSVELVKAHVNVLEEDKQYLEASIAARQFTLINPEHPDTPMLQEVADKNLDKFKGKVEGQLVRRGILGTAIRVGGCFILGSCNPIGAAVGEGIKMGSLVVRGESGIGNEIAAIYQRELPLIQDEEIVGYVNTLGQKIAKYMGRDDFEYEFYVVNDKTLNAFALPGGKVFIHTGAIQKTNSEAELAGLLAHEVSHAVLSHGFKQVITSNLYNNIGQVLSSAINNTVPLGEILSTLINLDYSRDQERQVDIVGTRVLATAGYAADGLHNLMVTLNEQKNSGGPSFLSSHPATSDRIQYIEELIERNGYNRFAFEGVEKHAKIQKRIAILPTS